MDIKDVLLANLTPRQREAVKSGKRRVLVVAGAGSGKTDVMSRRVAWWVAVDGVPKDSIVAFTFTEKAAEEMKFRIRHYIQLVTAPGADATLGGMYVGTIHSFCIKTLRELDPDTYHNYDVIEEGGRIALVQRGYHGVLGLAKLQSERERGQHDTLQVFLDSYDLLNEYDELDVQMPKGAPSGDGDFASEAEWCKRAILRTDVGSGKVAQAFGESVARYYAYIRHRRFLDFSTSQSELMRLLHRNRTLLQGLRARRTHIVVDEVQDVNVVQDRLIRALVGEHGHLVAVGDHRQAIFAWRGARVELMAVLHEELKKDPDDSDIIELAHNFRSTPSVLKLANKWASTIGPLRTMPSPEMKHGNERRVDADKTHVSVVEFDDRAKEAEWIAKTIRKLVRSDGTGASHDTRDAERGISYPDIAILIRSSTDARTYMTALEKEGIPAVFQAGPDLFSRPEVLLFLGVLAHSAGIDQFYGGFDSSSLPNRIKKVLECDPRPDSVIRAAGKVLRASGLPLPKDAEDRLLLASDLIQRKIAGERPAPVGTLRKLKTPRLVRWLADSSPVRRIFPQQLYHYLLGEAEVAGWDGPDSVRKVALFHLGQMSMLITGIETPGWTRPSEFKYQVIGLYLWGSRNARSEEAPLLVPPEAVSILTIHRAKGLEFPVVFVADVCAQRFPSSYATRVDEPLFEGRIRKRIDPRNHSDNSNYDAERRLMYVALTRAERYLFVTSSRPSQFFKAIFAEVGNSGGTAVKLPDSVPTGLRYLKTAFDKEVRLVTSYSDLRYYLECPHDFYLRKVLGFAPTINQVFGYGRGVHNLLRAIHSDPEAWAELAQAPEALKAKVRQLMERGLFYLRYTTGDPLRNMRERAVEIITDYVKTYAKELAKLKFEAEREFETLLSEEKTLISGAIDVIRLDDPPRVTLIDFKSGDVESDTSMTLDEEEMALQVSLYGLAAKRELEYQPELGLVRYLGESDPKKRQLQVNLDDPALAKARTTVAQVARQIRDRNFSSGPTRPPRDPSLHVRCLECDFIEICGLEEARKSRARRKTSIS